MLPWPVLKGERVLSQLSAGAGVEPFGRQNLSCMSFSLDCVPAKLLRPSRCGRISASVSHPAIHFWLSLNPGQFLRPSLAMGLLHPTYCPSIPLQPHRREREG